MQKIPFNQIRRYWTLYLFVLPSLVLMLTFAYFPAVSAVYHSFFEWDGVSIKIFVGLDNFTRAMNDPHLRYGFFVISILVLANIVKMIPSIATAIIIHRLKSAGWAYLYRVLFVIPMIIPGMVSLLVWKYFFDPNFGPLNAFLEVTHLMDLLRFVDGIGGWEIFVESSRPAWLSREELIIPSLIIIGFPWVGVVGVLIYLAGLANISPDVYDAAKIDGVGPFRMCQHIELPLILTQVRLNLVLMVIGTLQEYGLVLVLLGDAGGPGGAGMLPGLYMFRKAFVDSEAGYACAIGLFIFMAIVVLTFVNQKYVRVEK